MPPRRSDNRSLTARITPREADILEAEMAATGAKSRSAVLEQAVLDLLLSGDLKSLPLPSTLGESIVPRSYRVAPSTIAAIDEAVARHGYDIQDILRAAIAAIPQRPTQTGR